MKTLQSEQPRILEVWRTKFSSNDEITYGIRLGNEATELSSEPISESDLLNIVNFHSIFYDYDLFLIESVLYKKNRYDFLVKDEENNNL
jgi:hypothetical protein